VCPQSGLIFGSHDYRDQLRKAAEAVLDARRAATFTAYDLWYLRLTKLAEAGNIMGAAHLAGHKRPSTTDRYLRPRLRAGERALRAVGPTGFNPMVANPASSPNRLAAVPVCVQGQRDGIEIKRPAAAEELLEHALRSPSRRLIFFCSCELPGGCHRRTIAGLVKRSALRRGIDVNVVEWPGGAPREIALTVPAVGPMRGGSRRCYDDQCACGFGRLGGRVSAVG
jgi:hypothetical protein